MDIDTTIDPSLPILIAGPTASGKSTLAMQLAKTYNGVIVNADALQVFENWRVLTARPSKDDELSVPHYLYGHIQREQRYSVGHWLKDVEGVCKNIFPRIPIIVGGTGLYLSALTNGLAEIPNIPLEVRNASTKIISTEGIGGLSKTLEAFDVDTWAQIDQKNPARIQRAWEVFKTTGKGLAHWKKSTPPPIIDLSRCNSIVIDAPKEWLTPRIEGRFAQMVAGGALEECQRQLSDWDANLPSSKAIGAPELMQYLRGEIDLGTAENLAAIATRQYAKRQRSWFKSKMRDWSWVDLSTEVCG